MAQLLTLAFLAQCVAIAHAAAIQVPATPINASAPILDSFLSYSIEFAYFPDYAGNLYSPNTFSNNLLNNLGNLTGTKPYIRVGGNTQDYALYNASLTYALNGTIIPSRSPDYPTEVYIGPSYFESYQTLPGTKFTHGFNLGLGGSTTAGWETLLETVPLACKALQGKLLWWEYGNEPDLYSTSAQGTVRPSYWNESTYVSEWLNGTRAIKSQLTKYCPDLISNSTYGYIAPSFAGVNNHLKYAKTWADGLDDDGDIKLISSHNYISGATSPGVTLQGTLMNHTSTLTSVSIQLAERDALAYTGIPFILGETNSLYNEGKPGLSNSFGAALWNIDFALYSASQGIKRIHMHQGTNYRYASWQPIQTDRATIGTKSPYYGNIATTAFLGLSSNSVQILNLPLENAEEAAYAAYENGELKRVLVVNLREYNYTITNDTTNATSLNPDPRPSTLYEFQISGAAGETGAKVGVQRLLANGSDAITGITWDGYSYNWELDEGRGVKLGNVSTGEVVTGKAGLVSVQVADSEAVILTLGA